jgi:hypothetical protein
MQIARGWGAAQAGQVSRAQRAAGHEAKAGLSIRFLIESGGGGPWPRQGKAVEECARAGVYTARVSWKLSRLHHRSGSVMLSLPQILEQMNESTGARAGRSCAQIWKGMVLFCVVVSTETTLEQMNEYMVCVARAPQLH